MLRNQAANVANTFPLGDDPRPRKHLTSELGGDEFFLRVLELRGKDKGVAPKSKGH